MRVLPVLSLGALAFVGPSVARADNLDNWEVAAYGGYRIGGSIDVDDKTGSEDGSLSSEGSPSFGVSAGYRTKPNGFIYLWYSRQASFPLDIELSDGTKVGSRDVTFEYLQAGGYLEGWYGPANPYLGVTVGVTHLTTSDDLGSEWFFSAALEGGFKLPLTHWLDLRLLGRMPMTFMFGESQIYCVSPEGCRAELDGKPIVQGELQGGVGISF